MRHSNRSSLLSAAGLVLAVFLTPACAGKTDADIGSSSDNLNQVDAGKDPANETAEAKPGSKPCPYVHDDAEPVKGEPGQKGKWDDAPAQEKGWGEGKGYPEKGEYIVYQKGGEPAFEKGGEPVFEKGEVVTIEKGGEKGEVIVVEKGEGKGEVVVVGKGDEQGKVVVVVGKGGEKGEVIVVNGRDEKGEWVEKGEKGGANAGKPGKGCPPPPPPPCESYPPKPGPGPGKPGETKPPIETKPAEPTPTKPDIR